jgi:hypothetical protein
MVAQSASSSTTIKTTLSANNVGDLIVACCGFGDPGGTNTVTSVTDDAGNIYRAAAPKARNATNQFALYTFYAYGVKSFGANQVTFVISSAVSGRCIALLEYKSSYGSWTSDPFDKTNANTGNSSSLSSGSVTPTTDGQLILAWADTPSGTITGTGGFTNEATPITGDTVVDKVQVAKAAITATASSSGSGQWVMQVATFADVTAVTVTEAQAAAAALTAVSVTSSRGRGRALMSGG